MKPIDYFKRPYPNWTLYHSNRYSIQTENRLKYRIFDYIEKLTHIVTFSQEEASLGLIDDLVQTYEHLTNAQNAVENLIKMKESEERICTL